MSPSYRVDLPALNPQKVGIEVECTVCHRTKAPRGRSVPLGMYRCDWECRGYQLKPYVGSLWPGETEKEFGYPVADIGTTIRTDLPLGDCESCDGYILSEAERPYCPTCARERREKA